jgi:choline kinase
VQLLVVESTNFISVISFGKELYKRRERSERPDRFVSNGNYQPRSQGFSLFVIGKAGKGPGTGRHMTFNTQI